MKKFNMKWIALAVSGIALGGCLSNDDTPAPTGFDDQGVLVTASGATITIDNRTGAVLSRVAITGLDAGETVVDADYRHADGRIWILSSASKLYSVDNATNVATLRSTLNPTLTPGVTYAVDFNPVVDRLRVIGSNGENLAVNVESGAVTVDSVLTGPMGGFEVTHSAYTDTFVTATGRATRLFNLDKTNNALYGQNPAAGGVQTPQASLLVTAPTDIIGFDLPVDRTTGLAPMVVGGQLALYSINTSATANAATKLGNITLNAGETPVAYTQKKRANPTVVGLTQGNQFFTFRYLQPQFISTLSTAFTLPMGEKLLGMDYSTNTGDATNRPQSLYVLTSTNLYQTNSSTAPASLTGARALSGGTPLDNTIDYSVDFNPVNGGLRVVGSDDTNRAITIISTVAATIANNTAIAPTARDLVAHAYGSSIPGSTTIRLLAADATAREFVDQGPGTGTTTSLNAIPFAVARSSAFDIRYPDDAVVVFASKATPTDRTTLYIASAIPAGGINVGSVIGQIGGATGPTNILDLAIAQ